MSFSAHEDHSDPDRDGFLAQDDDVVLEDVLQEMTERFPHYLDDACRRRTAREIGMTSRALYELAAKAQHEADDTTHVGERSLAHATARAFERDADALLDEGDW